MCPGRPEDPGVALWPIECRYTGPSSTSHEGSQGFSGHAGTSRTVEPCGKITTEVKSNYNIKCLTSVDYLMN